jgi:DNA replication protein DnaD
MGLNETKNLDHIKAAKVIHDDAGRMLSELDGEELANSDDNFAFTDESINKAKKRCPLRNSLINWTTPLLCGRRE